MDEREAAKEAAYDERMARIRGAIDASMDGPNTHKYPNASFITEWTMIPLTDPDGVQHYFHVPTRILDAEREIGAAAAIAPRLTPDREALACDPLCVRCVAFRRDLATSQPVPTEPSVDVPGAATVLGISEQLEQYIEDTPDGDGWRAFFALRAASPDVPEDIADDDVEFGEYGVRNPGWVKQRVPTDVPGLREALTEIAWMGSDCPAAMSPESFYRSQLHHAIGTAARALAASPDAPRVAGLDVERLERAMAALWDIYGWDLHAMAPQLAAEYARLSDIGDTAVPPTSTEDGA